MGKIRKKGTIGDITRRQVRKIVQQSVLNDRKLIQSRNDSSVAFESSSKKISDVPVIPSNLSVAFEISSKEISDVPVIPANVDPLNFSNDYSSLNINEWNIDNHSSLPLPTSNEQNTNLPHLEKKFSEMDSTTPDNFILERNFSDDNISDLEITSIQDARKLNSQFDTDDTDEDETEISDILDKDEMCKDENKFSTELCKWTLKFHIT